MFGDKKKHRDLRTPNILLNQNYESKIADFGISNNMGYSEMSHIELYTSLVPPECQGPNKQSFSKKGDVYVIGFLFFSICFFLTL